METKVLQAVSYAEENFNLFVEQLKDLVRIPSISFPGFDHSKIDDSAKSVAELFSKAGLENVEILKIPNCFPYIYADWIHKKDAPTILLYAHHDVQPPMRVELWETPPFEPSERNGRLYGRGSADDKAGVLVHIASIASYLKTVGELPVNVKIIIEGEEEIGSSHLLEFLKVYKEKLKADAIILTDLANFDTGVPSLTTSLRGLVAIQVELYSTESPLHSGLWGGAIPDPIMGLCKVISGLTDEKGNIAIPEIYEMVKPTTQEELDDMKKLELTEELFRQQAKMVEGTQFVGGDFHLLEKMWKRPSLLVNCIQ
ncbi:M20/M25/M40 family metallo-hydrolase, partial [bacterium]|nr:M20/M25/M40 family metallo-hydrolase [bacterium]